LRAAGRTVVLITHRTSIIAATTKLMLLVEGQMRMYGETSQVLAALQKAPAQQAAAQAPAQQRPGNPTQPVNPQASTAQAAEASA
jgi:ATP-binding cassette subfamily C exporter for protease/lipase